MSNNDDGRSSQKTGPVDEADQLTGVVKWYCSERDFGFVLCDSSGDDALLHGNVLRSFGHRGIAPGSEVSGLYRESDNGLQITEVLEIRLPENLDGGPVSHAQNQKFDASQFVPARVKWFDPSKGFGFVNLHREDTDIFLHIAQLREAGIAHVEIGEALSVVVAKGERGAAVLAVNHWQSQAISQETSEG